jgi:SAM-dependent methyltransferase
MHPFRFTAHSNDALSFRNLLCPCCLSTCFKPPSSHVDDYIRCSGCGHRWRESSHVGSDHYSFLSARNDSDSPWFKRKMSSREELIQLLAITTGAEQILEVGCAEGELGRRIKSILPVRYDGIELSGDARQAALSLDNVFTEPTNCLAVGSYDLIVSFHVLEHIEDVVGELKNWTRLLSENGSLLIEVPNEAGHPLIDTDLNREHIHQFTLASLSLLLQNQGWECSSLTTGHYESPVYPDSIRAIARRAYSSEQRKSRLLQRFRTITGGPFYAYGIGGDFKNYIQPIQNELEIRALLDSDPTKWGTKIGQHTICSYDAGHHNELPFVVCSIKFGLQIKEELISQGISENLIFGLEKIYDLA